MSEAPPEYFDYLTVARECRLTAGQVAALEAVERREFPDDQMMFELHMLRVIEQIRAGRFKRDVVLPRAAGEGLVVLTADLPDPTT